jgi:hypothetical protein
VAYREASRWPVRYAIPACTCLRAARVRVCVKASALNRERERADSFGAAIVKGAHSNAEILFKTPGFKLVSDNSDPPVNKP